MHRHKVSEWFNFTKKERKGIWVLLGINLLFIIIPYIFPILVKEKKYDHSEFEKEIASLKITRTDTINKFHKRYDNTYDSYQPYSQPYENKSNTQQQWKGELFYFDPNTLDEDGWQRLGVRDKTIGTIKNYLSKGGRFYKPEDIKKIWGLHEALADKLIPYINIEKNEYAVNENKVYEKKTYTPSVIDVNTADTTTFIALPGIGSKLAQRIVIFRDKLGGFYNIEQVGETYGLADSTFKKIKSRLVVQNAAVKQMSINTATLDELKAHPYIRYTLANAIVQYRSQHGNFTSVSQLKNILLITGDIFNKMQPYLTL